MKLAVLATTAVVVLAGMMGFVVPASAPPSGDATPDLSTIPAGYRDWRVITVAHEAGQLNDLRAILGNDIAIKTYREGKTVLPEGAVIARLAWRYQASEENNRAFGREQSFVAGSPVNGLQFMIKDSKKYASTGGWGFSQFDDGKPLTDAAMLHACFTCHAHINDRDMVFSRYSP